MDFQSDSDSDVDLSITCMPYQYEPLTDEIKDEEGSDSSSDSSGEDDFNSSRIGHCEWCSCGLCIPMTTGTESLCCHEIDNALEKIEVDDCTSSCITEIPSFDAVCTNKKVLDTALVTYLFYEGPIDDEPEHVTYLYIAYRQWTAWAYGKLARRNRKPIPSCVVNRISIYPSEDGEYKGFEYARV